MLTWFGYQLIRWTGVAVDKGIEAARRASAESEPESKSVKSTENTSRAQYASKFPQKSATKSIAAGRRRRPGQNWLCGQCNHKFEISCDPNQVPREWWAPSNNAGGKSPWACPNCGTWLLTFPIK